MNILFITHTLPFPPDEGIKSANFNLIKKLSKNHKITLFSLIESEDERKHLDTLKQYCSRLESFPHVVTRSSFGRLINMLFQKKPFCVLQFYSREMADRISEITEKEHFDIAHFSFINSSLYRESALNVPSVLNQFDAMSMLFYRNTGKEKGILRKIYTYFQYKKMESYETETINKFDKTVVVSPKDKEWLLKKNKNLNIEVVPLGVDTEYFSPQETASLYPSIIFRGIMSFLPNIDAVEYFHEKILPLVREKVPGVKFLVVGKNPVKKILDYGNGDSVIVTGYVEDIREYMQRATVNVCPMRIGSGMKIKILESMALAKPTVATSIACEGIPDAINGKDILIADTPREFADKIVKLIGDAELCKKIGGNGREFVKENYSWEKINGIFEKVYAEAIRNKRNE